jgi:2-succinyl-5-enolpyruvyl-6-hydroxy-3-cyclohexene-1-carboxylate synthase
MLTIDALNESHAKLIISELVKSSVRYFLIAPGSRSTPLTLAASENPLAKTIVHFDERGLSFAALGIAKSTQNPVCLICTSGTALANFYPAIIEASMSFIPLIILVADRPAELRDVGSNQTIDQVKMFGNYLKWEIDIPCSDPYLPDEFLKGAIDQACFQAKNGPSGPVLINAMIREPLFSLGKRNNIPEEKNPLPKTSYYLSEKTLHEEDLISLSEGLSKYEKGVIIVGSLPPSKNLDSIYSLAMKLQWPIFADALSGVRSLGRDSSLIPFYNHLLQTTYSSEKMIPDTVLYLGGPIVSKTLLKWLDSFSPKRFYHVANFPGRHDPNHQITDRIECDPALFCQNAHFFIKGRNPSVWLSLWKEYSLQIEEIITDFFENSLELSEPHALFSLTKSDSELFSFFFSASLPIRYADTFFFPKEPSAEMLSNRGVSGIDGIIASSIGVAEGSAKPVIAFIGDLAFLHDINSLALAKQLELPIIFIVLNNSGGGIFNFLPIAENQKFMDVFVSAKHSLKMEGFAKAFDIPYTKSISLSDYQTSLAIAMENPSLQIIEVETNAHENYLFHQQIEQYVKRRLSKGKKEKQLYTTSLKE